MRRLGENRLQIRSKEDVTMETEYINLRGKNLLMSLTENGAKPIDREVIATLSTEDMEAMIVAIREVNDDVSYKTLSNLLEEDLSRVPDAGIVLPHCFHYWDGDGIELCDYGGIYSVIEKEQCESCTNYRVMVGLESDLHGLDEPPY